MNAGKYWVWHLNSNSGTEGSLISAHSPQDAATRHAEKAKLAIGKTVYATPEDGGAIYIYSVGVSAVR